MNEWIKDRIECPTQRRTKDQRLNINTHAQNRRAPPTHNGMDQGRKYAQQKQRKTQKHCTYAKMSRESTITDAAHARAHAMPPFTRSTITMTGGDRLTTPNAHRTKSDGERRRAPNRRHRIEGDHDHDQTIPNKLRKRNERENAQTGERHHSTTQQPPTNRIINEQNEGEQKQSGREENWNPENKKH